MQRKKSAQESPPKPSGARALTHLPPPNRYTLLYPGAGPQPQTQGLSARSLSGRAPYSPRQGGPLLPLLAHRSGLAAVSCPGFSLFQAGRVPLLPGEQSPSPLCPSPRAAPLPLPCLASITPQASGVPSHLRPAVIEPGLTSRIGRGGRSRSASERPLLLFPPRRPQPSSLRPRETEERPRAADALHRRAAAGAGAWLRSAAARVRRRARRILQQPESLRDAGQDLVSEPPGQGQATAGGRAGEAEIDGQAAAAPSSPPFPLGARLHDSAAAPPQVPGLLAAPWPPTACITCIYLGDQLLPP